MVTLVHNPSLILERIEKKIKEAEKNTQSTIVVSIICKYKAFFVNCQLYRGQENFINCERIYYRPGR